MNKLGCVLLLALCSSSLSVAAEGVAQPDSIVKFVERTTTRLFGEVVLLQQDVVSKSRPWLVGKAPVTAADRIRMRTPVLPAPPPAYVVHSSEPPTPTNTPPYWQQDVEADVEMQDSPMTPEDQGQVPTDLLPEVGTTVFPAAPVCPSCTRGRCAHSRSKVHVSTCRDLRIRRRRR